jgi:WxL Interacting Protein, peptidoglycan binding domain
VQPSRLGAEAIRRAARRLPLVLALSAITTCAAAASALAQGPAVIVKVHQASGLISPYFQLSASPGRTIHAGSLELVNPTSSPVRVSLAPVDAITTNTLGSAYAMTNAGTHGATTWLRLSAQKVTLAPHGSNRVSVSITVPMSATPGDYLAGVSVEALGQNQTATAAGGLAIGEIERYAIGVETKLAGPRHPKVNFTRANIAREPGGLTFLIAASNTGNVILKDVHGWVRVTDGKGVVAAGTVQPGTFVSGTSISYPLLARREQPLPGAKYRVRAALYYSGGVARLDSTVQFSHAAAVTQQNYGGRKLPRSTPPWRWIAIAALGLGLFAGLCWALIRRGRPLSRTAGLKLLKRALAPGGELPLSVLLISADRTITARIAVVLRPRLRGTDRICDLGSEGLVVICPATSRPAATALRRDLYEHLARHRDLADLPIEITTSTAVKPTTPAKLLERANAGRQRHGQAPAGPHDSETAATPSR